MKNLRTTLNKNNDNNTSLLQPLKASQTYKDSKRSKNKSYGKFSKIQQKKCFKI